MKIVDTIIIAAGGITVIGVVFALLAGCGGVVAQGATVAPAAVATDDSAERLVQRLLEAPGQVAEVNGVIYSVGIGESRDMQLGLNKAEQDARVRVARFVSGGASKFSVTLVGSRIEWRNVEATASGFRAVVLLTMPLLASPPQEEGMIMPQ